MAFYEVWLRLTRVLDVSNSFIVHHLQGDGTRCGTVF